MKEFVEAAEKTLLIINALAQEHADPRAGLLRSIVEARFRGRASLEDGEGEYTDIVVLNSDQTGRDYAADMRLVILVAALSHPEALDYITDDFPPYINPPNNNSAEAIAARIREANNLVGLWELTRQGSDSWLLQLVCPDGHTKPIHGTLLVR